jgi:hypothetical protein
MHHEVTRAARPQPNTIPSAPHEAWLLPDDPGSFMGERARGTVRGAMFLTARTTAQRHINVDGRFLNVS